MTVDSTRRMITEVRDRATVRYVDETEIEQGRTYYYVVETVDNLGLGTVSNERSATLDDLYPTAVELSSPEPHGNTTLDLTWTENTDRDFESYRLYRSRSSGVDRDGRAGRQPHGVGANPMDRRGPDPEHRLLLPDLRPRQGRPSDAVQRDQGDDGKASRRPRFHWISRPGCFRKDRRAQGASG